MNIFGKVISPAILIIFLMVLINAGIFFYFDHRSNEADANLQNQITQNRSLVKANLRLNAQQETERKIRTDQNCETSERLHLRDVQALTGSYAYLQSAQSDPNEKSTVLYKLVLAGLPQTIADGETDIAPEYCDEPGVGLKEPDPVIPERPAYLSAQINKAADRLEKAALQKDPVTTGKNTQDLRNK